MYDLSKRKIFLAGTVKEVMEALKDLPGDCRVHVCGSQLVALHVSADGKYCSFDETADLQGAYQEEMEAYLVELGVLLDEKDKLFRSYSRVYDKKHGYYDESQYYLKDKERAIAEAKKYAADGVEKTYAIVSKVILPADFDFYEGCVEDEKYLPEDVVYSVAKIDGKTTENFVCKNESEEKK